MRNSKEINPLTNHSLVILFISFMTCGLFASAAHAEWNFGIGTGLSMTNIDGTQGFNLDALGPIEFDVKLDPEDFNDYTKTALGFGGYAANGPWLIQYSYVNIELEDEESSTIGGTTATVKINFKTSGGELTVGYPLVAKPSLVLMVDGGLRYTKHEFDGSLTLVGSVTGFGNKNFDQDWTDAIVGLTLNVPLSKTWSWNTRTNAGFGGSEGTYFVSTGLGWRFHKNWSTNLVGRYAAVEFENGNRGDSDWYLYDVDESGIGLNVIVNW